MCLRMLCASNQYVNALSYEILRNVYAKWQSGSQALDQRECIENYTSLSAWPERDCRLRYGNMKPRGDGNIDGDSSLQIRRMGAESSRGGILGSDLGVRRGGSRIYRLPRHLHAPQTEAASG